MTPVAVTGIGVVSGFGLGVGPFWDGLTAGRSAIGPVTRAGFPEARGAEVAGLDVRAFVRTPQGRRIDRASLLALAACRLALADAGGLPPDVVPARLGLALGSAFGNFGETTGFLDRLFARGAGNPLVFPNLVMSAALSYVSIELGVTGPTVFVTDLEASGESAVAAGGDLVRDGRVDLCLAGGADELDAITWEVLRDAGLLARGAARPFAPDADGVSPGEGAAVLVLEPLARARARGARVYAALAPHPGFAVPAPVHGWPREAGAVADGIRPLLDGVDAVLAAASGQPTLDRVEAQALAQAFGDRPVPVTALRGAAGDFGAAGALAVAAGALAVHQGVVPPTVGAPPDATVPLVRERARRGPLRAVLVDGLARGGLCRPVRLEAVA